MTERSNSKLMGAGIAGGVIGAGIALMLAPRSRRESRDQINDMMEDLKQSAPHKANSPSPIERSWEEES